MDYRTAARLLDAAGVSPVYRDAPHVFGIPIIFNLPAVLIVTVITGILVWGIRESARFNAIMVGIKILVLAFFIVIGWLWVRPENWTPFAPNGWAGISAGAAIVFFAYIGFDAVSTVAEETKDPQRTLPVGILASLVICTIFYVAVAAVFTGLISYTDLKATLATEQAEPLTVALAHASPDLGWAVGIVAFGSVIAHTAVLLVFQLGQPRILFAMSRDGLLPPIFRAVHPRFRTPYVSSLLTGAFVATCAAFASIDEMVDLTNIGTLFAFILVCAGILVLRIQEPTRPRPFRVPGGWGWAAFLYLGAALALSFSPLSVTARLSLLVLTAVLFALCRNHIFPVLGIISCVYLIYYLPPTSWLRFAAWLNCGLVIYALYGAENSRLTGKSQSDNLAADAVQRVYTGAWLAVVGTVILFFTRGADLWIEALRKIPGEADMTKIVTALGAVLQPAPWIEPSWFLLLPLTLISYVLCPVLIRRAVRVRRSMTKTDSLWLVERSLLCSSILASGGIAYIVIVFACLWGFF
jgi:APA family basic amino acid/polyamine antiporter